MFQYAAGRSAAIRTDTELALDTSWFATQSLRRYELDHLPVRARVLPADEAGQWMPAEWTGAGRVNRLRLVIAARLNRRRMLVERTPGVVDERIRRAGSGTTLVGYWQSERYFSAIAADVRRELTADRPLGPEAAAAAAEIVAEQGVSVHIRRGDFTGQAGADQPHGVCSPDYYLRSMAEMDDRLGRPTFFAFSDDPQWVVDQLPHPRLRVVSAHNAGWGKAPTDLRLMSLARAHIISNSTFGWWGAWLARAGGPVIAPKRWFADPGLRSDDILPATWLRL